MSKDRENKKEVEIDETGDGSARARKMFELRAEVVIMKYRYKLLQVVQSSGYAGNVQ